MNGWRESELAGTDEGSILHARLAYPRCPDNMLRGSRLSVHYAWDSGAATTGITSGNWV